MPSFAQNDRHFLLDPAVNASGPAISAGKRGTCITIDISDASIEEARDCGFDRLVLERSSDSQITWQEITAPDTRLVLNEGQTDYRAVDGTGSPSYFYRTRYLNSVTGGKTDASAVISGEGLALRNLLTVAQLKSRYLFGLDLTDESGQPMSDAVFQHYILAAIQWLEHELDIPLLPTTFCDLQDYYRNDWEAFNFIKLDNLPLISVEEFKVQYPAGQTVITYPQEWLRINAESAQIQIVPTTGTLSQFAIGVGGHFLPMIYGGQDYLPHLFQIQYVAGFAEGQIPRNIIDLIGMAASLGPFNVFGDLIAGAGIANLSLSMDGLSQTIGTTSSATNAGYGARIKQYLEQLKKQIPNLRRYYHGISFTVA